ncbi:MAG: bacteriocin class II family protein [Acidobacteriota bacterium]|nr:bacteriocin class II family protein [Acidobacteriota bacterium]
MSFSDDIRGAKRRFPQHVKAFEDLFRTHRISSTASAGEALSSVSFREDMVELAEQLMKVEGGKLTFSIVFAIIGAALGGVGVAALGSAIGVPLALIGAFVGLAIGNEADSEGYTAAFMRKIRAFADG